MSAQYCPPEATTPGGSIVHKATGILEEYRDDPMRAPPELPLPMVSDLERRVRSLHDEVQSLIQAFVRLGEQLPTAGLTPRPGSLQAAETPSVAAPSVPGVGLPMLRSAEARLGEVARTALGLVNDTPDPARVVLRVTSLVNELGDEISSSLVTFSPNPMDLPGGAQMPVQVAVKVPGEARPGTCSGLVQAAGLEATRAVMLVHVKPKP
jgi:hypothetical protein